MLLLGLGGLGLIWVYTQIIAPLADPADPLVPGCAGSATAGGLLGAAIGVTFWPLLSALPSSLIVTNSDDFSALVNWLLFVSVSALLGILTVRGVPPDTLQHRSAWVRASVLLLLGFALYLLLISKHPPLVARDPLVVGIQRSLLAASCAATTVLFVHQVTVLPHPTQPGATLLTRGLVLLIPGELLVLGALSWDEIFARLFGLPLR